MIAVPAPLLLPDGSPARAAWSLTPSVTHVNQGSFGAVPVRTQLVQNDLRARMDEDPVAWFGDLPERVGAVRTALAHRLGLSPAATAIVANASAGASVVFANQPHRDGGEIVVTDHGYGAVTMGAERLARRWGGRVVTARVPLAATAIEAHDAVMAACTPRTALIVLDQISSATARFLPVSAIAASARARGIRTLVDGAHVPFQVATALPETAPDYWVGNLHKFGCAPRGTALLVAGADVRDELWPLIDSWGGADAYPHRFDSQGTLDLTAWLAAPDALTFIDDTWGWERVRQYAGALADAGQALLTEAFGALTGEDHAVRVGDPAPALRLIRLPEGVATTRETADALRDRVVRENGIAVAFTAFNGTGYLRISAHAYNTIADYERVAHVLTALLRR